MFYQLKKERVFVISEINEHFFDIYCSEIFQLNFRVYYVSYELIVKINFAVENFDESSMDNSVIDQRLVINEKSGRYG